MTLQAASQFSLPPTPHSPHSPHSNITSSTSGHSTSLTLSGTNIRSIYRHTARSFPLSTAMFSLTMFVPISPHISQPSVFRPDISCFTLIIHHVLHDQLQQLQACISYSARPLIAYNRCGAKGCRSARLRVCQALPVSGNECSHCCCTSPHLGGGPSSKTNERLSSPFFLDTQGDLRRRIFISEMFVHIYEVYEYEMTFFPRRTFSEKSDEFLGN